MNAYPRSLEGQNIYYSTNPFYADSIFYYPPKSALKIDKYIK